MALSLKNKMNKGSSIVFITRNAIPMQSFFMGEFETFKCEPEDKDNLFKVTIKLHNGYITEHHLSLEDVQALKQDIKKQNDFNLLLENYEQFTEMTRARNEGSKAFNEVLYKYLFK